MANDHIVTPVNMFTETHGGRLAVNKQLADDETNYYKVIVDTTQGWQKPRKQMVPRNRQIRVPYGDVFSIKKAILATEKVNQINDSTNEMVGMLSRDKGNTASKSVNMEIADAMTVSEIDLEELTNMDVQVSDNSDCNKIDYQEPAWQNSDYVEKQSSREKTETLTRPEIIDGKKDSFRDTEKESMGSKRKQILDHGGKKPRKWVLPKESLGRNKVQHSHTSRVIDPQDIASSSQACDVISLNAEEREKLLEEIDQAEAAVVTMVYQDGSSQLIARKDPASSVSGFLVLLKNQSDDSSSLESPKGDNAVIFGTPDRNTKYFFLKLEQAPFWAQQGEDHKEFIREIVLQILRRKGIVVCFKAKDFLRTVLQVYRKDVCWKQIADCEVLDPRIAAWLLDPSDTAPCFQELVTKHCGKPELIEAVNTTSELCSIKIPSLYANLGLLYCLMMDLCAKLQRQGLWHLFCAMELHLITVLAVMETHRTHVDKEGLKRTSKLLAIRLKQLEQEAHKAAGQQFLLTSSNQLRQVLFEKLRLHQLCEKKELPKTDLRHLQSTSEAVLLHLQHLHPLPKIILKYRQVHKIKSTYVDGLLLCMKKDFISSTWNQTGTVSGRLSARHPAEFM
nr:PREDICTED: DNA polymerase nu [Latimeria chalumnae]|eukprot:XP_014350670.1 PREDICTED: DNA polymerase nu [Latimeria chalumnae]